jgi:hypothetical protein
MAATFITREMLAERSARTLIRRCLAFALHLAVHGLIPQAAEVVELTSQCGVVELGEFHGVTYGGGLLFAFEAANTWPSLIPKDQRTSEYLSTTDEEIWMTKHGYPILKPPGIPDDGLRSPLTSDEEGLKRLLEFVDGEGQSFEYSFADSKALSLSKAGARGLAIAMSLRLGGNDDHVQRLLSFPGSNPEERDAAYREIAKSRRTWSLLSQGKLGNAESKIELQNEFENVRDVLIKRRDEGPTRPFKDKTIAELLDILNENTVAHDDDEDEVDAEIDRIKELGILGNRTILNMPARPSDIAALEEKLKIELPKDYREFLGISNGLEAVWNGFYRRRYLARVDIVGKAEDIWGSDSSGPLELVDWTDLPIGREVEWPILDLSQAISIGEGGDDGETWLVRPELVQQAVQSFFATYNSPDVDERQKNTTKLVISNFFGSMQEFQDMQWVTVEWTHWGIVMESWKSFKEFLESLALASEMNK